MARLWAMALCLATQAVVAQATVTPDVLHYAARIEPNLIEKTLQGRVSMHLRMPPGARMLELDRGELHIDEVRAGGRALGFVETGTRLRIDLPQVSPAQTEYEIAIEYHGSPPHGLQFQPDRAQLYTVFSTSQWLVAVDAPSDRATLDLDLILPAGLQAVGNGRALPTQILVDGRVMHRWRQTEPVPSYVFGFAAGRFNEAMEPVRGVELRYLAEGFSDDELRRVFADTGDMLRFFARRAGVAYAGKRYTQVLVAETVGQELAGFSLMSESYGREVLADPQAVSLIAHELAHQWWGNRVTCVDWNHFWLNEGFATYLSAAYVEHRFGRAAYLDRVAGWRQRVERLRAEGKDKPLVFAEWRKPSADDRAVVYQKGAYVLHLLRERMGERAFWKGLRNYTRTHIDAEVTTRDFQQAMQRASKEDLSGFFAEWMQP